MNSSESYIPLYHKDVDVQGRTCKLSFGKLAWTTVLLPLTSFVFCVIWSVLYDFEEATFTHCANMEIETVAFTKMLFSFIQVPNFLPSISAAIGSFYPQIYVWDLSIALHAAPRLLVASMYYKYYLSVLSPLSYALARMACWLNVVENFALIGLSFISSANNYYYHEKCFITFMVTSEIYMMLTCYLLKKKRSIPPSNIESLSLRVKWKLLLINMTSFITAGYLFLRHNWYCEPWGESYFFFKSIVKKSILYMHAYYAFT
ncbi:hypothetical protein J437_LFUL004112 [Ladona fulva]|uniref:CWH43-like N-terminal domain-containing protein n=1 Tax=Ladona fulva TaxID=123851 RepID=A0A8K0JVS9_LADFU|nr:hypothetical protein J437_LFUL004112 [Ladona fulva]